MGLSLGSIGKSIEDMLGGAVRGAQQVLGGVGNAANQAVQQTNRTVVRPIVQQVNRSYIQPQQQFARNVIRPINVGFRNAGMGLVRSQLGDQNYNQLLRAKTPLDAAGAVFGNVTPYARALSSNPITTPINMLANKINPTSTTQSLQQTGDFLANAPILKQVRQGINAMPIDPYGHKGETVVRGINENLVQPVLKTGTRFQDVTTGRKEYDPGVKGLSQYISDVTTLGSLAYTGGLAKQLAGATTLKAAGKLAPQVAMRQFGSGAGQNVVMQMAEGKKLQEVNPLEAGLAGAAYAALGTGLPLATKVLKRPATNAAQALAGEVSGQLKKTTPVAKAVSNEIDDSVAKVKPKMPGGLRPGMNLTRQGDVLDHPELYKRYPEIKNTDVDIDINPRYSAKGNGVTIPNGDGTFNISLQVRDKRSIKPLLIHEDQHIVDTLNGKPYAGTSLHDARAFLKRSKVELKKRGAELANPNENSFDLYHRNVGEVRARNAAARADMTPAERIARPFDSTEDVPQNLQLKFGEGGKAQSVNKTIPKELQPLAEEAKKYKSAEEFQKAFTQDIKHGTYYHVTDNPRFAINPNKGPRDMVSTGLGKADKGKLMITSDLKNWVDQYPNRKYVAEIDMSKVKPKDYYQSNRQFGNELYVNNPTNARVARVIPVKQALREDAARQTALEKAIPNKQSLTDLYNQVHGAQSTTLPKGYKLTSNGDVINVKTGKPLTEGEIQRLTQPKALTQAENAVNAGKMKLSDTQAIENKVAKPDPLAQLKQEARKYKSADEFVKAKTKGYVTVYHRTNSPLEDFGKTPTYSKENRNEFFVSNKKAGQNVGYGKNVLELRVKKSDLTLNDIFPSGENHYTVPTSKVDDYIKTKAQLTDIYNQATKKSVKLYHGSASRFSEFDTGRMSNGNLGKGIYLTDNPASARYYGELASESQQLRSGVRNVNPKAHIQQFQVSSNAKIKVVDHVPSRAEVATIKSQGFDGIRYTDTIVQTAEGKPYLKDLPKNPTSTMLFDSSKVVRETPPGAMQSIPEPKKPKVRLGNGSGAKNIGDKYEAQTVKQWENKGYKVTPVGKLKGALDNGIDVEARKGNELVLIQNKVRGEGKDVHLNTATLLWANAEKARKANPNKVVRPIIYTTQKLDTNAENFARSKGIEVVHTPMPGAKISNGVDPEVYRIAAGRIGQRNLDSIARDMPIKQRADMMRQIANPDSTLSKGLKDQDPNNYKTIVDGYYKAVDNEGVNQYGSLMGISKKMKYADTPEQARAIIQKEFKTWQKNVPAGTKNPLLEGLMAKTNDTKFMQKLATERNGMKLSRLIDDTVNAEPISAPFRRPVGMIVKTKKDYPQVRLESEPKTMGGDAFGNVPYGYNKTVANSRFISPTTKAVIENSAPTRGVLSNKQVAAKAREMVAADTNTARQYAEKNNDALSEAIGGYLIKHYNDTGDIGNATSLAISQATKHLEAGRFNQAAVLFNKLSPEGIQKYAAGQVMKAGKTLSKEQSSQLVHMAKKVQSMPDGEEKQIAMQELMNVIGKARGSAMTDKVIALWKSGLLSGPITTAGNLASNTSKAVVKKLLDDPLSAVYDIGFRLLTGKRTKTLTMRGERSGLGEGLVKGKRYMQTGYDVRNPVDKFDQKSVFFSDTWHGKIAQKYSDTIFRWMGAQDQPYFYAALRNNLYDSALAEAKNQKLHGQARAQFIKKFVNETPDDIMATAMEEARQAVFANKTVLSKLAARINQAPQPAVRAIGNFLMPFAKVPSSVAMEIMDRTPIGVAKEIVKELYNAKKLGTGFDQRAMSQALGKSTTGTIGLMGMGYALQGQGLIALAPPTTDAERNSWELQGKQPYSIKVGNNWLSMNYIQPFGSLVAMGAQFKKTQDDPQGGGNVGALTSAFFAGAQSVTNQSFLKGVGGALAAVTDPKNAESWLEQTVGSVVPNAVRTVARAFDPLQRQVNDPLQAIVAGIPGARETLAAKLNVFGEEIARPSGVVNSLINPLKPSKVLSTPFIDEIQRLEDYKGKDGTDKSGLLPASVDKSEFGKEHKLSPEQIDKLTKAIGPELKSQWESIMADPRYAKMNDDQKKAALKGAYSAIAQGEKYKFGTAENLPVSKNLSTDTKRYLRGGGTDYLSKQLGVGGTPKQKYEDALAAYNDKKKNGEISSIKDINEQENLRKLKAKSNFSQDANDAYSLSNKEIDQYLKATNNGDLWNELLAMDDALVKAGFTSKFRDKYGNLKNLAGGSSGGGGGRSGGSEQVALNPYKYAVKLRGGSAPRVSVRKSANPKSRAYSYTSTPKPKVTLKKAVA